LSGLNSLSAPTGSQTRVLNNTSSYVKTIRPVSRSDSGNGHFLSQISGNNLSFCRKSAATTLVFVANQWQQALIFVANQQQQASSLAYRKTKFV
jgi:hypothetical protein